MPNLTDTVGLGIVPVFRRMLEVYLLIVYYNIRKHLIYKEAKR